MTPSSQIETYEAEDDQAGIEIRLEKDTLWLSQAQMAELFERDSDTIVLHLKNIYAEGELDESATTEESKVVRKAAQSPELNTTEGRGLVEIISRYTQTFLWLQRYDEWLLEDPDGQPGGSLSSPADAMRALRKLKQQLIERGEATELFAQPRTDGLEGVL